VFAYLTAPILHLTAGLTAKMFKKANVYRGPDGLTAAKGGSIYLIPKPGTKPLGSDTTTPSANLSEDEIGQKRSTNGKLSGYF
jgi:hypothetical protein